MENCSFQESRPNFLLFWLAVNAVGVLASAAYFIYLVVIYATEGASDAAGKMAGQSSLNTSTTGYYFKGRVGIFP